MNLYYGVQYQIIILLNVFTCVMVPWPNHSPNVTSRKSQPSPASAKFSRRSGMKSAISRAVLPAVPWKSPEGWRCGCGCRFHGGCQCHFNKETYDQPVDFNLGLSHFRTKRNGQTCQDSRYSRFWNNMDVCIVHSVTSSKGSGQFERPEKMTLAWFKSVQNVYMNLGFKRMILFSPCSNHLKVPKIETFPSNKNCLTVFPGTSPLGESSFALLHQAEGRPTWG